MYTKTILASAALLATTALASAPGSAIVVNACTYPVYLSAVPAAGGGYEETDAVLQPKDKWTQQYTQLSNGNGWSIKLRPTLAMSNILQYEYTFHNDGIIWYDLSAVDGNPWNGNWLISSAGDAACQPKHAWYRYDTDDAFGMQSCASGASVTVTLCSGESQADDVVSAVAAGTTAPVVVAATSAVVSAIIPATTSKSTPVVVPTTTAVAEPVAPIVTGHALGFNSAHFFNAEAQHETVHTTEPIVTPSPTTFATQITAHVVNADMEIVTEVVTVVETAIAYETYVPGKRHVHHPNHPHFR